MPDGSFTPEVREAVMEGCLRLCCGCMTPTGLTIQHRRARGMGGTESWEIGQPQNGLVLCGSGTTGCHGWTEAHPIHARALGWRLEPKQSAWSPWWHTALGWRVWTVDTHAGSRRTAQDWMVCAAYPDTNTAAEYAKLALREHVRTLNYTRK